jgi:hypothetical protein
MDGPTTISGIAWWFSMGLPLPLLRWTGDYSVEAD